MARYSYQELLQKDTAELEKIKLVQEVYQSEDKYAFERKKLNSENLRLFGIAILTAAISLGSSYLIESFKQKNNAKDTVKKDFTELRKNYFVEKDKSKRNQMACDLSGFDNAENDLSISKEMVKFKAICLSADTIQSHAKTIGETDTSSTAVKAAMTRIDNLDKRIQVLNQQKRQAPATQQKQIAEQIKEVNKQITQVVDSTPVILPAVKSSVAIEQNVTRIEAVNNSLAGQNLPNKPISKSPIAWFKPGYFLFFGEYRILLQQLNKNDGIVVEVCKTENLSKCDSPLLTNKYVRYDSPLQFTDNNHTYQINLEAIDHAGNNPFTLAAYISFETLN
jgi:hypothetical protein